MNSGYGALNTDDGSSNKKKGNRSGVSYTKLLCYARRIYYCVLASTLCVVAMLVILCVFAFGVYKSGEMMTQTAEATMFMRNSTSEALDGAKEYLLGLRSQFPANQDVLLMRNVNALIGSARLIADRTSQMLEGADREAVNAILAQVDTLLSQMDEATVVRIKALVAQLVELTSQVTPQQVAQLVQGVGDASQHFGTLSGELEGSHLMSESASLLHEFKNTLSEFNGGHSVSLGWSQQQQKKKTNKGA